MSARVTRQDIATFSNFSKNKSPIIPGQVAVGQISETLEESNYFTKEIVIRYI